jgi:hypothetical protein
MLYHYIKTHTSNYFKAFKIKIIYSMKKVFLNLLALTLLGLTLSNCRKENVLIAENEQITAEDVTAHQDLTEIIEQDASEVLDEFISSSNDDRSNCPLITFEQPKGVWPNKITLDYSEAGCTKAGRTYKGTILIEQSGPMAEIGSTRQLFFNNFFVEGVKIEGTKTITNELSPSQGLGNTYLVQVDQLLTYPNGSTATYLSTRNRTWITGENTPTRLDDSWEITGNATGVNRKGQSYTLSITTPLIKKSICNWLSQGEISLEVNNKIFTLNYGDGSCDRDATVTFPNGDTREIKIRHYWWR